MEKLFTPAMRLQILQFVLNDVIRAKAYEETAFLCVSINKYLWTQDARMRGIFDRKGLYLFPELMKYKPTDKASVWFSPWDYNSRITIVNAAIRELQKQLSQTSAK